MNSYFQIMRSRTSTYGCKSCHRQAHTVYACRKCHEYVCKACRTKHRADSSGRYLCQRCGGQR